MGCSGFRGLMGFTGRGMPNSVLYGVCWEGFRLVEPFLADLRSTVSEKYSCVCSVTPEDGYREDAEMCADFRSVEII